MPTPHLPVVVSALDPEQGTTLLAPGGEGPGNWVGAASLVRDPAEDRLLLAYRERRPGTRGHRCVVAEVTDDGVVEQWSTTTEALGSVSIERPALVPTPQGPWRLYLSHVDASTGLWQVDLLEAATPDAFDVADATTVLTADATGTEGVKDPVVVHLDGIWFLYVNVVELARPGVEAAGPRSSRTTRSRSGWPGRPTSSTGCGSRRTAPGAGHPTAAGRCATSTPPSTTTSSTSCTSTRAPTAPTSCAATGCRGAAGLVARV